MINPTPTGSASGAAGLNDITVMVVDDSLVIRGLIGRMIDGTPGMRVLASVQDGEKAVDRAGKEHPDVVVLDIEMPVMDGLTALPQILKASPATKVVMASTLTTPNADASIKALALGAADYIPKPTSSRDISGVGGSDSFKRELIDKVQALGLVARKKAGKAVNDDGPGNVAAKPAPSGSGQNQKTLLYEGPVVLKPTKQLQRKPAILAVGSSTGGPQALQQFFKILRPSIGIPVVVTQHMPPKFTTMLADHITQNTGFPCAEGADGMKLEPGKIILAPGDFHMEIVGEPGNARVKLNQNPPENFCRPAVDPMFRSLIEVYGERILSVILTGMGSDGLKGGRMIVDAGGEMVAQDEDSSVVWGMPGAVATAGICSAVLPLDELPGKVTDIISKALP